MCIRQPPSEIWKRYQLRDNNGSAKKTTSPKKEPFFSCFSSTSNKSHTNIEAATLFKVCDSTPAISSQPEAQAIITGGQNRAQRRVHTRRLPPPRKQSVAEILHRLAGEFPLACLRRERRHMSEIRRDRMRAFLLLNQPLPEPLAHCAVIYHNDHHAVHNLHKKGWNPGILCPNRSFLQIFSQ